MSAFFEKYFADMLLSFYGDGENDFYDYLEDDVMWYGPFEGQMIRGKDELKKALYSGRRSLRFHVDNMNTKLFPLRADMMLIIAQYRLSAIYKSGRILNYQQHALIVIRKKRLDNGESTWKCPLIHISDLLSRKNRDGAQPFFVDDEGKRLIRQFIDEHSEISKIVLSGEGNSSYFVREDSIRYIEGGKGVRCYVHTTESDFTVNQLMKDIEALLPDYYYRCHASYIINLRCVKKISGYKVFLDDGTEIPVPVKKYAAVKEHIESYYI